MYVYPAGGQSEAQTSEDKYQCHVWAADQSGYDPTNGAGNRDDAEATRARSRRAWKGATMSSSRARRGALVVALASAAALSAPRTRPRICRASGHAAARPIGGSSAPRSLRVPQLGGRSRRAKRRSRHRRESPKSRATTSEQKHAERVNRVINGAAIGAGFGGLVRATQNKNPSNGVLAGAAVGAAIGAARDRAKDARNRKKRRRPPRCRATICARSRRAWKAAATSSRCRRRARPSRAAELLCRAAHACLVRRAVADRPGTRCADRSSCRYLMTMRSGNVAAL